MNRALTLCRQYFPDNIKYNISMMHGIVVFQIAQKKCKEAEEMSLNVLKYQKDKLGEDHADVIKSIDFHQTLLKEIKNIQNVDS